MKMIQNLKAKDNNKFVYATNFNFTVHDVEKYGYSYQQPETHVLKQTNNVLKLEPKFLEPGYTHKQ